MVLLFPAYKPVILTKDEPKLGLYNGSSIAKTPFFSGVFPARFIGFAGYYFVDWPQRGYELGAFITKNCEGILYRIPDGRYRHPCYSLLFSES